MDKEVVLKEKHFCLQYLTISQREKKVQLSGTFLTKSSMTLIFFLSSKLEYGYYKYLKVYITFKFFFW